MLSFRKRLALGHLAAVSLVLALTALAAYWALVSAVHDQLDAALLALAEQEVGMLAAAPDQPVRVHEVPGGRAPPSFARLDRLVQIVDAEGRVLARSANLGQSELPAPPDLLARVLGGETVYETLQGYGEEPVRLVSLRAGPSRVARIVQVAGSLDDVNHVVASASLLFLLMGGALVLAVSAAGALLSRRIFAAIDDVVQQAHRIDNRNLGERLPHPGTQDEIGRLVDTLNEMLDRIEHSFEAQRRFTADASHELRSPLSRLRAELEITLRRPRQAGEYVDALRSCVEEVERLTVLVEELLALARLDAGQVPPAVGSVALDEVVNAALSRVESAARQRGMTLESPASASPGLRTTIPAAPLDLVLANLLDNSIKYSAPGGTIRLNLAVQGGEVIVSVCDAGPGIAKDELPHLFERFYRGSVARSSEPYGLGLGLALSQAIMHAHGGRIEAANEPSGGARFSIHAPIA